MINTLFLIVFAGGFSLLAASLIWVRVDQALSDLAARKA